MAAVTAPGARRSLLGMVLGAVQGRARARGTTSRLAAAVQQHSGTFLAMSAAVADGFLHGPGWGLGVLVPAILVLDFKIQG
ncbi:MAG TPA: hypothetical protein VGS19_27235 [Streptosporangiaceae bacterium]|nr:hypothetical protein [Streptosporangiaceae bacterium]